MNSTNNKHTTLIKLMIMKIFKFSEKPALLPTTCRKILHIYRLKELPFIKLTNLLLKLLVDTRLTKLFIDPDIAY